MHYKVIETSFPGKFREELESLRKIALSIFNQYKHLFACQKFCKWCCKAFFWTGLEAAYVAYKLNTCNKLTFTKLEYINQIIEKQYTVYRQRTKQLGISGRVSKLVHLGCDVDKINRYLTILDDFDCPFLQDDICLIYDNRPIICILHASVDASACKFLGRPEKVPEKYQYWQEKIQKQLNKLNKKFLMSFKHIRRIVANVPAMKDLRLQAPASSYLAVDVETQLFAFYIYGLKVLYTS